MKYMTTDELAHFDFAEAYIAEIQKVHDTFKFTLDNVVILPENSCNRDVRKMRTNGMELKIQDGQVVHFIEEGYKVYDADGKLMQQHGDTEIPQAEYNDRLKALTDGECCIYSLEKEEGVYRFFIDGSNDRTYLLAVSGTKDVEEWDKFFNI